MNPAVALEKTKVEATLLDWMTVHGNLCLALRHPQNSGPSRATVVKMIHVLGKLLVDKGMLTQEELNFATRVEREQYGLETLQ